MSWLERQEKCFLTERPTTPRIHTQEREKKKDDLGVYQMHKEQGEPARKGYASFVTDFGESSCLTCESQIEMTCLFGP